MAFLIARWYAPLRLLFGLSLRNKYNRLSENVAALIEIRAPSLPWGKTTCCCFSKLENFRCPLLLVSQFSLAVGNRQRFSIPLFSARHQEIVREGGSWTCAGQPREDGGYGRGSSWLLGPVVPYVQYTFVWVSPQNQATRRTGVILLSFFAWRRGVWVILPLGCEGNQ